MTATCGDGLSGRPGRGYARGMIPGRFGCSVLALVLLTGAVLVTGRADAARTKTAETLYRLRPDARMCPSPACGGFWASRVNGATAACLGGEARPACYVATLGLQPFRAAQQARIRAALPLGRALIGGSFVSYPSGRVPEARLAAGAKRLARGRRRQHYRHGLPRRRHRHQVHPRAVFLLSRDHRERRALADALGARPRGSGRPEACRGTGRDASAHGPRARRRRDRLGLAIRLARSGPPPDRNPAVATRRVTRPHAGARPTRA